MASGEIRAKMSENEEYHHHVKRAEELFSILRDLPRFGINVWHHHFLKTFDAFKKLWNYQREKRDVLVNENVCTRNDIGETAIKIAQLYYHYFLHTSDLKYLREASSFYQALQLRYFTEKDCKCIIKKLRCACKHFVVGLILQDSELINRIIQHMKMLIDQLDEAENGSVNNRSEFTLVYKEARKFIEVDKFIKDVDVAFALPTEKKNGTERNGGKKPSSFSQIGSILLVGLSMKQVKFSELTIDMYRMLLFFQAQSAVIKKSEKDENNGVESLANIPHISLLYKPTFETFFNVSSAIFKDINASSILLIYISGDGLGTKNIKKNGSSHSINGIATSSTDVELKKKSSFTVQTQSLYLEDFIPFTRKPLCLIVDSDASHEFLSLKSPFNMPLLCLLSPTVCAEHCDRNKSGSLFTMFLSNPILGICSLCKINEISSELIKLSQNSLLKISQKVIDLLLKETKSETFVFDVLLNNEHINNVLSNHALCWMTLRLHRSSKDLNYLPRTTPPIPHTVFENKTLQRHLLDVMVELGVREQFHEISDLPTLFE